MLRYKLEDQCDKRIGLETGCNDVQGRVMTTLDNRRRSYSMLLRKIGDVKFRV